MNTPQGKRRWYQFSLKTLLVAVTVAAIGMGTGAGWWNHRQFCRERADQHVKGDHLLFGAELLDWNRPEERRGWAKAGRNYHQRLANDYEHAIWRPWERFWIDETPPPGWEQHPTMKNQAPGPNPPKK